MKDAEVSDDHRKRNEKKQKKKDRKRKREECSENNSLDECKDKQINENNEDHSKLGITKEDLLVLDDLKKRKEKKRKEKKKRKCEEDDQAICLKEENLPDRSDSGALNKDDSKNNKVIGEDNIELKRRKREKRLRKKELKRKHKESQQENKSDEVESRPAMDVTAGQYLTCWSTDRESWKFNKKTQTWLLTHMYTLSQVTDQSFAILLEYLEGLKGSARHTTLQQANKLMKDNEDDSDSSDDEKQSNQDKTRGTNMSEEQLIRVKQIIQLLG